MSNSPPLLVTRVAEQLRKEVLAVPAGTFLGSEAELVRRFDVSRPTFRQAAKLLEQEMILVVKAGIGGGYFSRQPDSAAVAHMVNLFLQSRHATVDHVMAIFDALYVLAAGAAAAGGEDKGALSDFIRFVQQQEEAAREQREYPRYLDNQGRVVHILADLGGNPLMKLFFTITRDILRPYLLESVAPPAPEQIARAQATRLRLLEAVRDGNRERSEFAARQYLREIQTWAFPGRSPDLVDAQAK